MSTLANYGLVAIGGALGAMARMGAGQLITAIAGTRLPWHTFAINITGSLCLGYVATAIALRGGTNAALINHLVAIGFLGAYTTFSTFELETWNLFISGRTWAAIGYVFASVTVGLAAIGLGVTLARWTLA